MKQRIYTIIAGTPKLGLCGVLFALVTVLFAKQIHSYNKQGSTLMAELFQMENLLSSKEMWDARAEWIGRTIPRFDTQNGAANYLLHNLKKTLSANNLKFESHFIYPRERPTKITLDEHLKFDRAMLDITVKGDERDIVKLIHTVQEPGNFAGVDSMEIEIDEFDLRCKLRVSQWYIGNNRSFDPRKHHQPEIHYISPSLADSR